MWVEKKLGEICDVTSSKRIYLSDYVGVGIPFFRSKEAIQLHNGEKITEPLYISKEKYDLLKSKFGIPKKGDILLTSVGTIGVPYYVQDFEFYFKDGNLTWLKNFDTSYTSKFIYYWINSAVGRGIINNSLIGSSQQALTIENIKRLSLSIPPLITQQKIADILSAYDDLIENNNQRIELLEQGAQQIYKEWFVHFRFPGYETTRFVKGIPDAWEVKSITEMSDITDGTHETPKPVDVGCYLVTGKNIVNDTIDFSTAYYISEKDHIAISKRSGLEKGNILFSNIGTIGSTCIIGDNTDFSVKNVIIIKPFTSEDTCYLYCLLKNITTQEIFKQQASGASQQFIALGFMRRYKILIPDINVLKKFSTLLEPILNEKSVLQQQNQILIKQRDLLLPRLMSGKIEV